MSLVLDKLEKHPIFHFKALDLRALKKQKCTTMYRMFQNNTKHDSSSLL